MRFMLFVTITSSACYSNMLRFNICYFQIDFSIKLIVRKSVSALFAPFTFFLLRTFIRSAQVLKRCVDDFSNCLIFLLLLLLLRGDYNFGILVDSNRIHTNMVGMKLLRVSYRFIVSRYP